MSGTELLLSATVKVTLILSAAFAINAFLGRASAAWRHVLWTTAVVSALLVPVLPVITPAVSVSIPSAALAPTQFHQAISVLVTAQRDSVHWPRWILFVWAIGFAVVIGRLLIGLARLSRIDSSAKLLGSSVVPDLERQIGIPNPIQVKVSSQIVTPMTWGVLQPTVLLPQNSASWPEDRFRIVLAHELIHVKRHDCASSLIAHIACAVYWFHPLVWVAASRLRKERECACDDAVLSLGSRASDYAAHLVDLARILRDSGEHIPAVAMAQASDLEVRLKALLNPSINRRRPSRRGLVLAVVTGVAFLLGISTVQIQAQSGPRLHGVVFDPSGAVVPNATVVATNIAGSNKEIARSGDAGEYSFGGIPEGRYLLEVRAPGFAVLKKDVSVKGGSDVALDLTLEPGQVMDTVNVVAKGMKTPPVPATSPGRVRVGGNVQPVKLITQVKPVYPAGALARGAEGSVLLRAVIAMNGSLLSIKPLSTLVDPELIQAAMDAVKQWQYQPTLLNGMPIEVVTDITVNFAISE